MARLLFALMMSVGLAPAAVADETNQASPPDQAGVELKSTSAKKIHRPTDAELQRVNVDSFGLVREFRGFDSRLVGDIAISADGKMMMASCRAKNVAHWDVATGALLGSFERTTWRLAFAPSHERVVVVGPSAATLVQLGTGEEARSLGGPSLKSIVATAPKVDQIAFGLSSGEAVVWDPKMDISVRWQIPDATEIMSMAFSRDGAALFVQTEKSVRQFESKTGRETRKFEPLDGKVKGSALSPDATFLAVAMDFKLPPGDKPDVIVFDTTTGKPHCELRFPRGGPRLMDSRGFAFTPDSDSLLLHDSARSMIVRWDVESGEVTLTRPLQDYHHWIVFSPDRRHYFTHCGDDRDDVIRMWQVDPWSEAAEKERP